MRTATILLYLCISIPLMSCSVQKKKEYKNGEGNQWETLVSGEQCSIESPKQILISQQKDFNKLWENMFSGIDKPPVKPSINFQDNWLLVCYLGMVNTSGHNISIQSITNGKQPEITLQHSKPDKNCLSAQVIEFPYFIASITPLISKDVAFTVKTNKISCE